VKSLLSVIFVSASSRHDHLMFFELKELPFENLYQLETLFASRSSLQKMQPLFQNSSPSVLSHPWLLSFGKD
jgi:hypothetical protein